MFREPIYQRVALIPVEQSSAKRTISLRVRFTHPTGYRNLRSFRNIFDLKVEINLRDLVHAQLKSADMIVGELRKLREAIEKR